MKEKRKNNKIRTKEKDNKIVKYIKKIIIGILYLVYLIYLYILLSKWELACGGNTYIGIFQIIIPISAIRFINLVLDKKIKISTPN